MINIIFDKIEPNMKIKYDKEADALCQTTS